MFVKDLSRNSRRVRSAMRNDIYRFFFNFKDRYV
jgi:hypothetical protein